MDQDEIFQEDIVEEFEIDASELQGDSASDAEMQEDDDIEIAEESARDDAIARINLEGIYKMCPYLVDKV